MNSAKQYMNSAKQCVNSEPMWGYCSRAEKKKKKKRQKTWTQQNAVCKRSHYQDYKIGVTSLFNMKSLLDKTSLLEKQKLHELTNI